MRDFKNSIHRLAAFACASSLLAQPIACHAAPRGSVVAAEHDEDVASLGSVEDERDGVEHAVVSEVEDVVISEEGLLVGRVRTESGRPIPSKDVEVMFAGGVVASTRTDASGTFRVAGLREGVHEIRAGETTTSCRLWNKEAAPPQVRQVAHVSCCDECPPPRQNPRPPQRGQLQRAFAKYPLATTALIGAGLGAAIAIPIATSQKPASP